MSYTPPSGGTATYTVSYTPYTVRTNFGCSGISEFGPTSESLVNRITLPDGSYYQFNYEQNPSFSGDVTGRVASVQLPSGGTISYTYTGGNNGIECTDGSPAGLHRSTPDTGSNYWSYSRTLGSPNMTTITDPQGNQTVSNFSGIYELQRIVNQGTNTPLETLVLCYNNNFTNCSGASVTAPITKRDLYRYFPNLTYPGISQTMYNSSGLLTDDREMDYVAVSNGSPYLSDTQISYASLGNGILDKPASVTVYNNSGTMVAQTTYSYDQTGLATPSGTTPQWVSVSGSRGNPTTITNWVSTTSSSLTKTISYYNTGNVDVVTDANGGQTSYNYPDATSTCGNAFPTSLTEAVGGMTRDMAWNCTGGAQTSATDENGQVVSTNYTDADFWRPNSVVDQLSNTTNLSYTGQTSAESSMVFDGSWAIVDSLSNFDGLGRVHVAQRRQAPTSGNYDSVETDYDPLGRPNRITVPYSGTLGQTNSSAPATATSYDALGRVSQVTDADGNVVKYSYSANDVLVTVSPTQNTKKRQNEYDALGRLTSVCEITNGTTPWPGGNCGQNTSSSGYLTTYAYDALGNLSIVTQNAQSGSKQTRSYQYDGLSRMTSETNPESGTTTYTYDSAPGTSCGNFPGDLGKKTDANGNWTCYNWDKMHRLTDVGNNNQNGTNTCKRLRYDNTAGYPGSTKPSGLANTLGRLTEATTDQCGTQNDALTTDEWFGYTARGEVSDFYEKTTNSGGYYHVVGTYFANGAPSTISQTTTSPAYQAAWLLDTEGRIFANTGDNPVASTGFNTAGQPTVINYYSTDDTVLGQHQQPIANRGAHMGPRGPAWNAEDYRCI